MGGPGSSGANDSPFIVPLGDCDFAADRVLEGMIPEGRKQVRFDAPLIRGMHIYGTLSVACSAC
jgi:hypothetical protein